MLEADRSRLSSDHMPPVIPRLPKCGPGSGFAQAAMLAMRGRSAASGVVPDSASLSAMSADARGPGSRVSPARVDATRSGVPGGR